MEEREKKAKNPDTNARKWEISKRRFILVMLLLCVSERETNLTIYMCMIY